MSRRLLITGGRGFVGRHLAEAFTRQGREPVLPSREVLTDPARLDQALAGVETVVHLAARVHVMDESSADPLTEYRQVNVALTERLVQASIRAGVTRFLLASSVKAVGESNHRPWTEQDPPAPVDPYGVSKLEAEESLARLASGTGMGSAALRLPLVYGPGVGANFLRLLRLVDRGFPLPLGAIRNHRSMVGVSNLVAALDALSRAPLRPGERFFVSDQRDLSTPELIRLVAAALGRPARLIPVPLNWIPPVVRPPSLSRLLDSLTVDSTALSRRTGWRPAVSVEEELARTADWYRTSTAMRRN